MRKKISKEIITCLGLALGFLVGLFGGGNGGADFSPLGLRTSLSSRVSPEIRRFEPGLTSPDPELEPRLIQPVSESLESWLFPLGLPIRVLLLVPGPTTGLRSRLLAPMPAEEVEAPDPNL